MFQKFLVPKGIQLLTAGERKVTEVKGCILRMRNLGGEGMRKVVCRRWLEQHARIVNRL